jgi:5-methyltetrahydrofolate--homocysteine methyltransferase
LLLHDLKDVDALWTYLEKIFNERVVVLDGGMGTQLQTYKLQEEDYRGKRTVTDD